MQRYPRGSGTFRIGSDIAVNRLGIGAMCLTDEGIWGEPADRAECLRVLRRLPELGVTFIDTAHSCGPDVSEHLIRVALHPYGGRLRGQGGHDHDAGRCRQPAGPGIAGRLGVMKHRGLTPILLLNKEKADRDHLRPGRPATPVGRGGKRRSPAARPRDGRRLQVAGLAVTELAADGPEFFGKDICVSASLRWKTWSSLSFQERRTMAVGRPAGWRPAYRHGWLRRSLADDPCREARTRPCRVRGPAHAGRRPN